MSLRWSGRCPCAPPLRRRINDKPPAEAYKKADRTKAKKRQYPTEKSDGHPEKSTEPAANRKIHKTGCIEAAIGKDLPPEK